MPAIGMTPSSYGPPSHSPLRLTLTVSVLVVVSTTSASPTNSVTSYALWLSCSTP